MKLHRIIATLLCVALLATMCPQILPTPALAEGTTVVSGTCGDNLTWTLDDAGTLTISGTGDMAWYSSFGNVPWYRRAYEIRSIVIESGVTDIGQYMFYGCTALTSVTIPTSVTRINYGAFYGCSALPSLTIPAGVTSIDGYAFYNCNKLTDVYYGGTSEQWTQISIGSYNECLTNATIYYDASGACGDNLTWMLDDAGKLTISGTGLMYGYDSYYSVPWCDFSNHIKSVVIESGVTSIGSNAFNGCSSLTSVTIPASVTAIGYRAFNGCSSLTSVTIPAGMTTIGHSVFFNCSSLTSVTIPASVTSIGSSTFYRCSSLTSITIMEGVTSIESSAFRDCKNLTSITIPTSMTSIGNYAFYGCTGLTDVYYNGTAAQWTEISIGSENECLTNAAIHYTEPVGPEIIANGTCGDNLTWTLDDAGTLTISGIGAMYNYDYDGGPWYNKRASIKSVVIEEGVTAIGKCAFLECNNLTDVTIPDSVTVIVGGAFQACTALTSIPVFTGVTVIGNNTFAGCTGLISATIPEDVTTIGDHAFFGCRALTDIAIPDSVTVIENYAFGECEGLAGITIPESVTRIGDYAFQYCTSLTSVTISDGVTSIGDYAFRHCRSLVSIKIPESVTSIGNAAFMDCAGLTSIQVETANTVYHSADNCLLETDSKTLILGCKNSKIPADGSVTSIGANAFYGCTDLSSITIPDSVINTGVCAFYGCTGLASITIGNGVTNIGNCAFYGCTSLTNVTIPDSVTSIEGVAFGGCTGLNSITISASVTGIGDAAFMDCTGLTDVYYTDAKEQAEAIAIGQVNECLQNAKWHYEKAYAQDDLQSVIDEAESGTTVILTKDLELTAVSVWDGVTLDLNGHTLSADYFTCFGSVTDGEAGGTGLLIANKGIHLAGDNSFLPIYDTVAGGYRFYRYELQNLGFKAVAGNEDAIMVGIRLKLNNTAGYDVLATTSDEALDVLTYLNWQGLPVPLAYSFQDDTLRSYASKTAEDLATNGTSAKAILLTISGIKNLEAGTDFTTQPAVTTAPGVTAQADSIAWTVQ